VRYVVIGMVAAAMHGSPLTTIDADVCPSRDPDNLERLARALREIGAQLREDDDLGLVNGGPIGVSFDCTADFLAARPLLQLLTRFGELDLVFEPSGTGGFEDLDRRAESIDLQGLTVRVARLEDVIRSKEASNRPKDQRALPLLRQLLEEIRGRRC
jgi:hypothetical protein